MQFNFREGIKTMFGYNSIVDKGRRQAPKSVTKSEDVQLRKADRRKLTATSRDQVRNVSILAWMLRRHLDYVSRFNLHIRTGNEALDLKVRQLFAWHSRKTNFDIAQRHDRNAMMRLFEMCKVLDGDCAFLKTDTGALQAIESDRITRASSGKIPKKWEDKISEHGLVLNNMGRTLAYAITKRGEQGNQYIYDKVVQAENVIFDGYYTRFDQTRGISPLSTVINMSQDVTEILEANALKAKIHALFGLAFMRENSTNQNYNDVGYGDETSTTSTDSNPYDVQMNPKGILTLDLDPGDKIETIESRTPSAELVNFTKEEIRMIMLALDIPYTAYDSMATSFSARIADRAEYEESAERKREKNIDVLHEYSDWKIDRWSGIPDMLGNELASAGMSITQLKNEIEWIPAGTPWLDKVSEVKAEKQAIAVGLSSTPRSALRRGEDAYKIIDEQADYLKYAESKGVPLYYADGGQESILAQSEGDMNE